MPRISKDKKVSIVVPPAPFLMNEKVNQPLGPAYIMSYLKANGYPNVEFHHVTAKDLETKVKQLTADVFCFSFVTPQVPYAVDLMNFYKQENPDSLFVCGGVHPSVRTQECLDFGFDVAVKGEGEIALVKILDEFFKEGKKALQKVYALPQHKNLDDFPFPDYEGIGINDYQFNFNGKNLVSIITSRGCPFSCHFCSSPTMWESKVRLHSAEYVKGLIKKLKKEMGLEAIMFQDDVFPLDKERLTEICNFLYKENITYRCLIRSNLSTDYNIKLLKDTGCFEVGIGIESFDDRMLKMMNKRISAETNRQAIQTCRKHGMQVKAFIMYGIPGETKESIERTIAELEKNPPDDIDVNILYPYPGTEFRDNITAYDLQLITDSYYRAAFKGKIGQYECPIATSGLTAKDLEEYKWLTFNKFSRLAKKK